MTLFSGAVGPIQRIRRGRGLGGVHGTVPAASSPSMSSLRATQVSLLTAALLLLTGCTEVAEQSEAIILHRTEDNRLLKIRLRSGLLPGELSARIDPLAERVYGILDQPMTGLAAEKLRQRELRQLFHSALGADLEVGFYYRELGADSSDPELQKTLESLEGALSYVD